MAGGKIDLPNRKLLLRQFDIPIGEVTAQSYKRINAYNVAWYSIPSGYYPIGFTRLALGNQWLSLVYVQPMDVASDNNLLAVRNDHASSKTGSGTVATLAVIFAPEEMVELTTDLSSQPASDILKEPVFKIKQYTSGSTSVGANTTKSFSQTDLNMDTPSGYEVFSIRNISTGHVSFSMPCCDPLSTSLAMAVRNRTSSSANANVRLGVTYINSKYKEHITIANE